MDYQKEDLAGYVEGNVALQATSSEELIDFIKHLSTGSKLLKVNFKHDYVARRTHPIDGLASKRLKEAIEAL